MTTIAELLTKRSNQRRAAAEWSALFHRSIELGKQAREAGFESFIGPSLHEPGALNRYFAPPHKGQYRHSYGWGVGGGADGGENECLPGTLQAEIYEVFVKLDLLNGLAVLPDLDPDYILDLAAAELAEAEARFQREADLRAKAEALLETIVKDSQ